MSAIAIKAVGAITSVGEDAPATVGSIFTEAQALEGFPVEDADESPAGAATPIPGTVKGVDRLVALGGFALRPRRAWPKEQRSALSPACPPTRTSRDSLAKFHLSFPGWRRNLISPWRPE